MLQTIFDKNLTFTAPMKLINYSHTSLSFNNTVFHWQRIKGKRRCKRMTTNFQLYSRCLCRPGRLYNTFIHTYIHTHTHTHTGRQRCPQLWQQMIGTASTLQNNIEITDQQKNIVSLIVELLDCKIQQEYSVLPSCTRPGVFKHKLDFLNLFWLIDDFWFVLICKICGFYV